jgi:hypothetical protein
MVWPALCVVATIIGGCGAHPERACVAPGVPETVTDTFYTKLERSLEGNDFSADHISAQGLNAQARAMRANNFATFEDSALKSFDKTTRLATCTTIVHFHLNAADRSSAVRAFVPTLPGLTFDPAMFGPDPSEMLEFTAQPLASGKDTQVTMGQIDEALSLTLGILLERELIAEGRLKVR